MKNNITKFLTGLFAVATLVVPQFASAGGYWNNDYNDYYNRYYRNRQVRYYDGNNWNDRFVDGRYFRGGVGGYHLINSHNLGLRDGFLLWCSDLNRSGSNNDLLVCYRLR